MGASCQAIKFQLKQAHKANENQITLTTDRHQFPETRPLFTSPPHHRRDLNKKTRRRGNNDFIFTAAFNNNDSSPPLSHMHGADHEIQLFVNALKDRLGFSRSSANILPQLTTIIKISDKRGHIRGHISTHITGVSLLPTFRSTVHARGRSPGPGGWRGEGGGRVSLP